MQKHREQVANLILKDEKNQDLIIVSPLEKADNGAMVFTTGEDDPDGARYRVTVKIEEI